MLTGFGSESATLTEQQVYDCCSQAFSSMSLDGRKVLVIIPDHTRTAPIDMMFRVLSQAPEMYDDLWTGGKCMYKLEPVMADGGS